jgi:hypothetical protein
VEQAAAAGRGDMPLRGHARPVMRIADKATMV